MADATLTPNQYGTLLLKDWLRCRDGRAYIAITGRLAIVSDQDLVGFRAKSSDNWVAIISGPTEKVSMLGCQIRGFHTHASDLTYCDAYEVP